MLGKEPPLAEGPAPNYEVETPETMRELFEPHLVEETYERRVRQQQQIRQRIGQVKKEGKRFAGRMKEVEGGKDGVVYGVEARKEQFRHLIFENVDGKPVVVRERLPDAFTDMNLDALLRMAVQCNAPDMGIVSEIALYGMRSETACRPTTASWPLYKGGIENIEFLQANRDKQRSGYMTPRVSQPAPHPRYEPERTHPKGVVIVLKEDGAEKNREVTDYAAQRLSCYAHGSPRATGVATTASYQSPYASSGHSCSGSGPKARRSTDPPSLVTRPHPHRRTASRTSC